MDRKQELLEELQHLQDEPITLPADVMLGYSTGRPELLVLVNRSMKKDEVRGVMDALSGQIKMNQVLKNIIEYLETQNRSNIDSTLGQIRNAIEKLEVRNRA